MKTSIALSRLSQVFPRSLRGSRLGAVLHPASVDSSLRHTQDVLLEHHGSLFRLSALFGPQHGIKGHTQDNMIEWEGYTDPRLGIPVYSLYGEHRKPTPSMLSGLDALFVDLQDVGARYYTFIWTLYLCMEACEAAGIPVIVVDRPNPIRDILEGPVLDLEYKSFVGLYSIPVRHGKTIGELARQFKEECFPKCELHVLEMEGYRKEMWFDETGLPWVMPSPNMPTLDTAIVYPGMCLFEATNVSEGRGTTRPFELFGAPFIQAEELCRHLNSLHLPGVFFRENYFQPTFHKGAGTVCGGAQIHVLDRNAFLPFETAIQILRYLFKRYPDDFKWKEPPYEYEFHKLPIDILLGNGTYRKEFIEK
ncbi:MAG: DUF1343 domain-containing protein [Fibrobacter sp.]|jgi:uncharacterized protein YbbC (DUF1343 family)|nr:DUF1343 domain-containing protein [Fibrobacter sp.]